MLTWVKLIYQILTLISKAITFFKLQKAKKEGREEVIAQVNKETEKLKNEFKEIDRANTDFDAAIRSLRGNSSN